MSRKIIWFIFVFFITVLLALASYQMLFRTEEAYKISVILTGTSHDRWFAVKEGMEQAATDYNVTLNLLDVVQYPTTNDEWDLVKAVLEGEDEKISDLSGSAISEATDSNQLLDGSSSETVSKKADAVIVEPIGKNLLSAEEADAASMPIILMDSDVDPEGVYDCVHADDEEIGRMLADKLYEEYGDALPYQKIGIVAGEANRMSMIQRLQGFYEQLHKDGGSSSWTLGLSRNLESGLKRQLSQYIPDVIVSLGSLETEVVVDYIVSQDLSDRVSIYGEGYSEKTVYYLEKGVIDCLVTPNEFTMGYLAVEHAVRKAENSLVKIESSPIDLYSVRSEELYKEENQQIFFPHIR